MRNLLHWDGVEGPIELGVHSVCTTGVTIARDTKEGIIRKQSG